MRINHNIAALNTYRQLNTASSAQSKSMEKLSSGLRINKAGDDAAGLAISEKMRAQVRGLDQASKNAQDGISMIQTAEGALNETHDILQRMRELATQASNDTNTESDRGEIQKEMNQLTSEINRIGNTTEFNTQSLLKGKNAEVVETAAAKTTITAGAAGVAEGATSALTTNAKSIKAVASTASVQASTSQATGAIDNFELSTNSVKGEKGTTSLSNGISFSTTAANDDLNGATIEIVQSSSNSTGASISKTGSGSGTKYTIELGTDGSGNSSFTGTTRGELFNYVKGIMDADTSNSAGIQLNAMTGSTTDEALTTIVSSGNIAGGVDEVRGEYEFELTDAFNEAGDTISFGGKTFTAVFGAADLSKGEFSIGTNAQTVASLNTQATNLKATILDASQLGDRFASNGTTAGKVELIETATKATGVDVTAPTVAGTGSNDKLNITDLSGKNLKTINIVRSTTDAVGSNSAANAIVTDLNLEAGGVGTDLNGLTIKFGSLGSAGTSALNSSWDADTKTLTVNGDLSTTAATAETDLETYIGNALTAAGFDSTQSTVDFTGAASATAVTSANLSNESITFSGGKGTTAADTMSVQESNGELTIYLADTTASKNSAENIQKAVQALGQVSTSTGTVDFSKYVFEGEGNWDSKTIGNSIESAKGTLVGGTHEVKGNYSFSIDKAFDEGDKVEIAGQVFTAVASDAEASEGQFNISAGNLSAQAASLRDAISLNAAIKDQYTIGGSGTEIKLTEKVADGKDLVASDLAVRATGTQGEYAINVDEVLENGATFKLDGQEITVSNKETHVGYADGTAIKEAATAKDQAAALASAINSNENLKNKYTASVNDSGELVLKQTEDFTTDKAPEVTTTNSPLGKFEATFQVGANAGQSMTIEVEDMRSNALSISGDGSASTVAAKDGKVASFVKTANVSDGTSNNNSEFALDVSSSEKASAAISVINDAIEKVSAQRSQLGAFQNRLDHTINNLNASSENLTAAESRIRDVDMAKEMMTQTKNSILSQAAQAMLAQANQQPQGVLQLLR